MAFHHDSLDFNPIYQYIYYQQTKGGINGSFWQNDRLVEFVVE